jgi:hypothetical protein
LEGELEYLRQDRSELRTRLAERDQQLDQLRAHVDRREQQWTEREQQWTEREQQWEHQRAALSQQIGHLEAKVGDLALQLKISQKKVPSSEKGAPLAKTPPKTTDGSGANDGSNGGGGDGKPNAGAPSSGTPSQQKVKYLHALRRERPEDPAKDFDSRQAYWESVGSDADLIPAPATIFASRLFAMTQEDKAFAFTTEQRLALFGRAQGLHSKTDETTVYDLRLSLVQVTCTNENLHELGGGSLYVRKGHALGPAGFRLSWETLATVVTFVAEYGFPMERLAKAVGHDYFTSANISRWCIRSAISLVDVYIALGKALGARDHLRMDDTSALVLALRAEARAGLVADKQMNGEQWEAYLNKLRKNKRKAALIVPVIEAFGRVAERADKTGAKISVNVTLVSGQLIASDYRSKVYFYRTHFGQAGNLLSRMLEHRPSAATLAKIVVQSDCSAQNHLEAEVAKAFDVTYIGCTSHARRPIFRYKNKDEPLCFYLLRCFAALAGVEARIAAGPRTHQRILRHRQRYSAKIWALIKAVCQAVVDEKPHPIAGKPKWRKDDKLYDACLYIIWHWDALTFHLNDPRLDPDNNAIEQGLRGEKIIENSALFRHSELGRIALDIHRTFIATCNACSLEYRQFLRYVMNADAKDVKARPEAFFPHAVAATIRAPPDSDEPS